MVVILLSTFQLMWVYANGGDLAMVILLECWCWIVFSHVFIYVSFGSFSCVLFPCYTYNCGLKFLEFCLNYGTLRESLCERRVPILK